MVSLAGRVFMESDLARPGCGGGGFDGESGEPAGDGSPEPAPGGIPPDIGTGRIGWGFGAGARSGAGPFPVIGWLLDTNVIAELARAGGDPRVLEWARSQDESRLFVSILTFGEYTKGIHNLPPDAARRSAASTGFTNEARFPAAPPHRRCRSPGVAGATHPLDG